MTRIPGGWLVWGSRSVGAPAFGHDLQIATACAGFGSTPERRSQRAEAEGEVAGRDTCPLLSWR